MSNPWRKYGTLSCQLFAITKVHWVALKAFFYIFNARHIFDVASVPRLLHFPHCRANIA